jgi:hypothetical protein
MSLSLAISLPYVGFDLNRVGLLLWLGKCFFLV